MRRYLIGLIIFSLLFVAGIAFAQEGNNQGTGNNQDQPRTIEELYLSQDVEVQILRQQALSSDRQSKLLALQTIRSMVENGELAANNPGVHVILESLATEGTRRQVRSEGRVVNNFPEIRRQAANILGELGENGSDLARENARDALMTVLEVDDEPMVLAEAVFALGQVGVDDEGDALDRIMFVLNRENAAQTPDNNLAFATLLAVERISGQQGGITDPELITALLEVASGSYIRDVRLKAIDVIYNIRHDTN
jgi:HEAT repeat protein